MQYIKRTESKFDSDIGVLEIKYILADVLVHIGREANNIEGQPLNVVKPQTLVNVEEIKQKILALIHEEAR